MLMTQKCNYCGDRFEYIPEQVGHTVNCRKCSRELTLQRQDGKVAWQIIGAACFALMVAAYLLLRMSRLIERGNHQADRRGGNTVMVDDDED